MRHFSRTERLELSILLKKGYSLRDVGTALGRSHSSVSRELKRNRVNGVYDPRKAHHKAYVRRKYSKYQGMKIRDHTELEKYIKEHMPLGWSPERIAGRWKRDHPRAAEMSPQAIYRWLYSQYGQYYCKYLKYKRYRRRKRRRIKQKREIIKNRVFIEHRPLIINARAHYGDFEADTMGRPKTASPEILVVLRERKSRYILAEKVRRLKHAIVGFKELLSGIPVRSITFDNGVENVRHLELGVPTYFCHPYSSWEKGQVENGIEAIREYIPKGSDLADYSDSDISAIVNRINRTPMKCLDYQTPREVFFGRFLMRSLSTGGAFDS